MKIVKKGATKRLCNPERIKREITVIKNADHPNILRIFEYFEDKIIFIYLPNSISFSSLSQ